MQYRNRVREFALMRKEEKMDKILTLLRENPAGLTGVQISVLAGNGRPRDYLFELRRRGLIKQRKGLGPNGRPAIFYILNKNPNKLGADPVIDPVVSPATSLPPIGS